MADVDPAFEKQILDITHRQGEPNVTSTTKRITSGKELKRRKGLGGKVRDLRGHRRR